MANLSDLIGEFNKREDNRRKDLLVLVSKMRRDGNSEANWKNKMESEAKEAEKRQSEFLADLRTRIESVGISSREQAEISKQNLCRLGLIEPIMDAHKRRGLADLSRISGNADLRILAAQLSHSLERIEKSFHDFEDWASERLVADKRPWCDLSSAANLAVYFQHSSYGAQFHEAVT